jgi:hypothetical protein
LHARLAKELPAAEFRADSITVRNYSRKLIGIISQN